jgi:hypothetical protein
MAFGQPSGTPASAQQLDELLRLVRAAGWDDFRDARHPLGLNQRQAGGRFSRAEADALIEQLQHDSDDPPAPAPPSFAVSNATRRLIASVPAELLAEELERRGWVPIPPA